MVSTTNQDSCPLVCFLFSLPVLHPTSKTIICKDAANAVKLGLGILARSYVQLLTYSCQEECRTLRLQQKRLSKTWQALVNGWWAVLGSVDHKMHSPYPHYKQGVRVRPLYHPAGSSRYPSEPLWLLIWTQSISIHNLQVAFGWKFGFYPPKYLAGGDICWMPDWVLQLRLPKSKYLVLSLQRVLLLRCSAWR